MSAEPGRKAPYSDDIRWRIVWQRTALELPFSQVAQNLNISVGTAFNIFKLFQSTGGISPTRPNRQEMKVLSDREELLVLGFILENPALYLNEVQQKLFDTTGTLLK